MWNIYICEKRWVTWFVYLRVRGVYRKYVEVIVGSGRII